MAPQECTPETPCPQAKAAADLAVKTVFAIVGVDVDNPAKVEQFRDELRFNRQVKRVSDRGILAAIIAAITIGTGVILAKLGVIQ